MVNFVQKTGTNFFPLIRLHLVYFTCRVKSLFTCFCSPRLFKKEALLVLSREFYETFQNSSFTEYIRTTAFDKSQWHKFQQHCLLFIQTKIKFQKEVILWNMEDFVLLYSTVRHNILLQRIPEAATRGVLWKKVFLEISQNS